MNISEDNFNELEEQLKVKTPHLNRLKCSIQQQASSPRKSRKPVWLVAVSLLCLFVITSPFYSPALANIVAKVKPLVIEEQNGHTTNLTDEIIALLESNGYAVSSVGILTKDNVIEIGLMEGSSYSEVDMKDLIMPYIFEQGYDTYTIDFVEVEDKAYKGNPIYDEVRAVVKSVFANYGYAKEADYELAGIQKTWFSNILLLDMPDHIKEADEIVEAIEAEIEERDLNVKKVEVYTFNLAHRNLDNAWGTTASTIYNSMAGQSAYQLEGLSYSVKKGHAKITMKTAWTEEPSPELAREIEQEILNYLQSDEVISYLPEQSYTIRFVNGKTILMEISNK